MLHLLSRRGLRPVAGPQPVVVFMRRSLNRSASVAIRRERLQPDGTRGVVRADPTDDVTGARVDADDVAGGAMTVSFRVLAPNLGPSPWKEMSKALRSRGEEMGKEWRRDGGTPSDRRGGSGPGGGGGGGNRDRSDVGGDSRSAPGP